MDAALEMDQTKATNIKFTDSSDISAHPRAGKTCKDRDFLPELTLALISAAQREECMCLS